MKSAGDFKFKKKPTEKLNIYTLGFNIAMTADIIMVMIMI